MSNRPTTEKYLAQLLQLMNLSPAQTAALVGEEKASLVTAGAGAGKTRVLVARGLWLLLNGVDASSILALSFTQDSRAVMEERVFDTVTKMGIEAMGSPRIRTFHAFAAEALQGSGEVYTSLKPEVSIKMWIQVCGKKSYDHSSKVGLCKSRGILNSAEYAETENPDADVLESWGNYDKILHRTEEMLVDFDDSLILLARRLEDPKFRTKIQAKYSCILVDEFQDLNVIQHRIISLMCFEHKQLKSLWACGDERQTIYAFRGAVEGSFERFLKEHNADIVNLPENRRSDGYIVDVSTAFSNLNEGGLKTPIVAYNKKVNPVLLYDANGQEDENEFILEQTRAALEREEQVFILSKTNAFNTRMTNFLGREGIKVSTQSTEAWWHSPEVNKIVNLFRAALNPHEQEEALRNLLSAKLDKQKMAAENLSRQNGLSYWESLCFLAKKQEDLRPMIANVSAVTDRLYHGDYALAFAEAVERTSIAGGIAGDIYAGKSRNVQSGLSVEAKIQLGMRLNHISQQLSEVSGKITPREVPSFVGDAFRKAPRETQVEILTVHKSKGLERDTVIIGSLQDFSYDPDELQESRRVIYVGLTRAVKHLFVTGQSQQTPFFEELHESGARYFHEDEPVPDDIAGE